MVGKCQVNHLKVKEIYHWGTDILRCHKTFHYTLRQSAGSSRGGAGNVYRGTGMRDWLLLTTIMVLGFGFMLGKLAYDEWRIKRRNHGAGS